MASAGRPRGFGSDPLTGSSRAQGSPQSDSGYGHKDISCMIHKSFHE